MTNKPTVAEFFAQYAEKGTRRKFKVRLRNGDILEVKRIYPFSSYNTVYQISLKNPQPIRSHAYVPIMHTWTITGQYHAVTKLHRWDIVTVYGWFGRVLAGEVV